MSTYGTCGSGPSPLLGCCDDTERCNVWVSDCVEVSPVPGNCITGLGYCKAFNPLSFPDCNPIEWDGKLYGGARCVYALYDSAWRADQFCRFPPDPFADPRVFPDSPPTMCGGSVVVAEATCFRTEVIINGQYVSGYWMVQVHCGFFGDCERMLVSARKDDDSENGGVTPIGIYHDACGVAGSGIFGRPSSIEVKQCNPAP